MEYPEFEVPKVIVESRKVEWFEKLKFNKSLITLGTLGTLGILDNNIKIFPCENPASISEIIRNPS